MQADTAELVAFGPEHIEGALRLSRQANWGHRREDWEMSLALSEGYVAVAEGSRVVGTALVTKYKSDAATINMVIVDQGQRGRGLGRKLMEAALALVGEIPLRLVATLEGLPLYEKMGFREVGAVVQYQGAARFAAPPDEVLPARPEDFAAIAALDREAFGADRGALIARLRDFGDFVVLRRPDGIAGFAALRRFGLGAVIGPVVAAHLGDAEALVAYFIAAQADAFLRVDADAKTGLGPWLSQHGLLDVGRGVDMQRPIIAARAARTASTFALASQALG